MAKVKATGGVAYKFTSPQRRSVPDRLVLRNGDDEAIAILQSCFADIQLSREHALEIAHGILYRYAHFVETKATGAKPTGGQCREHTRLRALGFTVLVIDNREETDKRYGK